MACVPSVPLSLSLFMSWKVGVMGWRVWLLLLWYGVISIFYRVFLLLVPFSFAFCFPKLFFPFACVFKALYLQVLSGDP